MSATQVAATSAAVCIRAHGHEMLSKILAEWQGPFVGDATRAAYTIGLLVANDLLTRDRAKVILDVHLKQRKVSEEQWPEVFESFDSGRVYKISVAQLESRFLPTHANDNALPQGVDAETLMGMEFEPLNYVIPQYIVEGLTVLAGKPKLGKSWWAYDASIAVATGGKAMGSIPCEQGDVLYLALEDNLRRVQDRIRALTPLRKQLGINLSRLEIRTASKRIDTGLLDELEAWRTSVERPRLLIIDVYMKVRPPRKKSEDAYAADYAAVLPLQQYASQHRLAVVLVTHTRKMEAEDPIEAVSGTNGVTGAADAILVLSRGAKGTTLYGRGRDIEEIESAIKFDAGRWTLLGDAQEVRISGERRQILEALRKSFGPLTPKEVAKATGMKDANVRQLVAKMLKDGEVSQPKHGIYTALKNTDHSDNTDHSLSE